MVRNSTITTKLTSDRKKVWSVVTDNKNYHWRSDLKQVEILNDGNEFIETTKDGFSTKFSITSKKEPYEYTFSMVNKVFTGCFTGRFVQTDSNGTYLTLTERLSIKNPFIWLFSFAFMNLRKVQETYVHDLKLKLGE